MLGLAIKIGWRYTRAKHSNGFISFISMSSLFGVALGVMVLILVLSAMNGFERELKNRLLEIVPHGEFRAVDGKLEGWRELIEKLEQEPGVIAASPQFIVPAMLQRGDKVQAFELRGIDAEFEDKVSSLSRFTQHQSWQQLMAPQSLILGASLADKLGVTVGDKVSVLVPQASHDGKFKTPKAALLTLVDTFKIGGQLDGAQGYVSLGTARRLLKIKDPEAVPALRLKLEQVFEAPYVVRRLAYNLNQHVYMHDWTRTQGHLYQDIQMIRSLMYLVMSLVIAVACFNIICTLVMAVNEKKADIAILKTLGLKTPGIVTIFVFQGVLTGVTGCVLGTLGGVALSSNLSDIIKGLESLIGHKFLSADVYFIDFLPSMFKPDDLWAPIGITLILSVLATLYPAIKASRVAPAAELGGH